MQWEDRNVRVGAGRGSNERSNKSRAYYKNTMQSVHRIRHAGRVVRMRHLDRRHIRLSERPSIGTYSYVEA